jgi:Tfp pilus assembly protein PilN
MPADFSAQKSVSSQTEKHADKISPTSINLSGRPKESTSSVFYKWTIQIGRIVIVLTELVALSALFYRFIIDRQIADLNDQIDRQVNFIHSQEQRETQFRSLHNRLSTIQTIKNDTNGKVQVMNTILQEADNEVFTADSLAVNKNLISVSGITSSVFALNSFVDTLKSNKFITSISLNEITSGGAGIMFKMEISLTEIPQEMEAVTQ